MGDATYPADPAAAGPIIGVWSQMSEYKLLFGLELSNKILCITDNLSKALQSQSMTAAEGQKVAELSVQTLKSMRTDECFTTFFRFVNKLRQNNGVAEAVLPRARKAPHRFDVWLWRRQLLRCGRGSLPSSVLRGSGLRNRWNH